MSDPQGIQSNEDAIQNRAEACILGSVIVDRGLMAMLGDVSPEHFVDAAHRAAWRHVLGDATIDDSLALQIAVPELTETQADLIQRSRHGRDTVQRAKQRIMENRSRRELREALDAALKSLDDRSNVASAISHRAIAALNGISSGATSSTGANEVAAELGQQGSSVAIPTGLAAFDYVSYGGLHVGQLTGLLARYKDGKTVMMATIARNLERQGVPTLMVSLERRKNDVERFVLARALDVDARDLDLIHDKAQAQAYALYMEGERHLRYIHKPGITIDDLRARIIAEVQAHGVKVVLVDYWQLITLPNSRMSQQEKQQEAAQMLADLASDLDICILVTAQLNQEGQPRGGEGILAAAGIVIELHRPHGAPEGFLLARVSNKGKPLAAGSPQEPTIVLLDSGPHFADRQAGG